MRIHGHAVLTRVSHDTRRLMDATCQRHGVRLSDFLREAIFDRLAAEGLDLPPEAAFHRARPGQNVLCREAAR